MNIAPASTPSGTVQAAVVAAKPETPTPATAPAKPRTTATAPDARTANGASVADTPNEEKLVKQAVKSANQAMDEIGQSAIRFGYEKRLERLIVQVTDTKTNTVVKQIPSKEFIEQQVAIRDSIGMLLDKKG